MAERLTFYNQKGREILIAMSSSLPDLEWGVWICRSYVQIVDFWTMLSTEMKLKLHLLGLYPGLEHWLLL